jgi:hypothetical protein
MYYEQQYLKMNKWSKNLKATISWQYDLYGPQIRTNTIYQNQMHKMLDSSKFLFLQCDETRKWMSKMSVCTTSTTANFSLLQFLWTVLLDSNAMS